MILLQLCKALKFKFNRCCFIPFLKKLEAISPFCEALVPMFCVLHHHYTMDSSDSPLAWHLLVAIMASRPLTYLLFKQCWDSNSRHSVRQAGALTKWAIEAWLNHWILLKTVWSIVLNLRESMSSRSYWKELRGKSSAILVIVSYLPGLSNMYPSLRFDHHWQQKR